MNIYWTRLKSVEAYQIPLASQNESMLFPASFVKRLAEIDAAIDHVPTSGHFGVYSSDGVNTAISGDWMVWDEGNHLSVLSDDDFTRKFLPDREDAVAA